MVCALASRLRWRFCSYHTAARRVYIAMAAVTDRPVQQEPTPEPLRFPLPVVSDIPDWSIRTSVCRSVSVLTSVSVSVSRSGSVIRVGSVGPRGRRMPPNQSLFVPVEKVVAMYVA